MCNHRRILFFVGSDVSDRFIEIQRLVALFGYDFLLNTFIELVYLFEILLQSLLFGLYNAQIFILALLRVVPFN